MIRVSGMSYWKNGDAIQRNWEVRKRKDKFSSLLVRHASAYTQGELIL